MPILKILELIPRDFAGVRPRVDIQRELFRKNQVRPIRVSIIDDQRLVMDGCNRVIAAMELGRTEINVEIEITDSNDVDLRRNDIKESLSLGLLGFNNIPILGSDEEREELTTRLHRQMLSDLAYETLIKDSNEKQVEK